MTAPFPLPLVVVGIDDGPSSVAALRWAVQEARQRWAVLRVVHLVAPGESDAGGHELLDVAVAGVVDLGADPPVEKVLLHGWDQGPTERGPWPPATDASDARQSSQAAHRVPQTT